LQRAAFGRNARLGPKPERKEQEQQMATYYAITSTNRVPEFYGIGSTKKDAREDFDARVPFNAQDIYSVTRHRNVEIIPESAAIRRGLLPRGGFVVETDPGIPTHGYRIER
jgi:hypothetical protein